MLGSDRSRLRQSVVNAFHALLRLYPAEFRDEYSREMTMLLSDRYRDATGCWERILLLLEATTGVLSHAPEEHIHVILQDLRYALRLLRRSPAFTFTAVLSLAIGIGANTAIFAVAKKVIIDTLPVKNPDQLRMLTWVSGPEQPVPPVWGDVYPTQEGGLASTSFSFPVLHELRKNSELFADLIAFKDVEMTATVNGNAEVIPAEMLGGSALSALGIQPALGRTLMDADDSGPQSTPVALISTAYWQDRFSRSPSVLGKTISLNGVPVTIVGVVPPKFTGLTTGTAARIFVPLTLQPLLMPRAQRTASGHVSARALPGDHLEGSLLDDPQSWWLSILICLRPNIPEARVQAGLDVALRQAAMATLPGAKGLHKLHLRLQPGARGLDYLSGVAKPSYVLIALAALVLLLACVNLANLLLARAASRQREMSTRLALGAGNGRLLRQLLTEGLLLSSIGGIAGLLLGYWGRNAIPRLLTYSSQSISITADFDWEVLAFTAAASLLTGILFGTLPVWHATRCDVNAALKDESHATVGRRNVWLGNALVVLQVSLSTILLIGAGLFVRTLVNLTHTPLGFRTDHMLLFKLDPPRTRYTDRRMLALYGQVEQKLAAIAGVRSVTLSNIALMGDGHSGASFHISGRPVSKNEDRVQTNAVAADFFQTMGIRLLAGRSFNAHDNQQSAQVAVVNRALVRKYLAHENPIGQTFESDDASGPVQIIGVVADTRYADLRSATPPTFYVPYRQRSFSSRMMVEIRTAVKPLSLMSQVRAAVKSLDQDLPLIGVRTQEQQIQATLSSERAFAQLMSGFGLLALALAGIGIYGLMAYTVSRRKGEFGIRMALGARAGQVLAAVLRQALWVALAGVGLGIMASLWLARLIGAMLYGLSATDPVTMALTALLLICIALMAGVGPGFHAARLDPVDALRHE